MAGPISQGGPGIPPLGESILFCGRATVWQLPPDSTCARLARHHVRAALSEIGLPEGMVDDAVTMVSELASNVFVHALGGRPPAAMPIAGLPELYIYRRWARPEVVVKVYDSAPWKGPFPARSLRPDALAEGGRGFEVVNGLAAEHGGRWGVHRTRSHLGTAPVSGKACYFALPIPYGSPAARAEPLRRTCRQAARELESALSTRGLGPLHRCDGWNMAVLSVRAEITVWARQNSLSLTTSADRTLRYPLHDVAEMAEVIVHCSEDLDAR